MSAYFEKHREFLTELGVNKLVNLKDKYLNDSLPLLLGAIQTGEKTYTSCLMKRNDDVDKLKKFAEFVFELDEWGLKALQSTWLSILEFNL